jgi:hypothetical protein
MRPVTTGGLYGVLSKPGDAITGGGVGQVVLGVRTFWMILVPA